MGLFGGCTEGRGEAGPGLERVDKARNYAVAIPLRIGERVPWDVRIVVRNDDEPVNGDEKDALDDEHRKNGGREHVRSRDRSAVFGALQAFQAGRETRLAPSPPLSPSSHPPPRADLRRTGHPGVVELLYIDT